jgi:hypothetical protein
MYCAACGTQLAPGLSFCNRCGMSLKEPAGTNGIPIKAFLTAITVIGTIGLGIMLGGAIALTTQAHLKDELVGFFYVVYLPHCHGHRDTSGQAVVASNPG